MDPYGIFRFKIWGLGLKIMLCLGSYVLKKLQGPDFMFLATGSGNSLDGPNFFISSI